jgi:hypothetical protein
MSSSNSGAPFQYTKATLSPQIPSAKPPSQSHRHPHTTEPQTCNSLLFNLVQNVGQAKTTTLFQHRTEEGIHRRGDWHFQTLFATLTIEIGYYSPGLENLL